MPLVLCDGSEATLRAIDIALLPQFLVGPNMDAEQVVFVHVWKEGTVHHPDPVPSSAPMNADGSEPEVSPMIKIVRHIAKSKVAAQVNYKIETVKISAAATMNKQEFARRVTEYGNDRVAHHKKHIIVLGVGNFAQQGKSILSIGSVAKREATAATDLVFCKVAGTNPRARAPLRFTVVLEWHHDANPAILLLQRVLQQFLNADRKDTLAVLLVANSGLSKAVQPSDETLTSFRLRCEMMILTSLPHQSSQDEAHEEVASAELEVATVQPQLFTTLFLESTKEFPSAPTVDQVPQQLIKALGSVKCDFVVVQKELLDNDIRPSTLSLLSAPKPHVILLHHRDT